MTPEDRADKNEVVSQELSLAEQALSELNERIGRAGQYLMTTFFRDDTWEVRQAAAYGFSILGKNGGGKDRDGDREEQLIKSIFADLGDRLAYYEAAYHFPDVLAAFRFSTAPDWVEMMAERSNEPVAKVAETILAKKQEKLAKETEKFEQFLNSDIFGRAFSIKVDKETGEYEIVDLKLDPDELRARWQELLGDNSN